MMVNANILLVDMNVNILLVNVTVNVNILLVNVNANVNAPGTHCFSAESAASCCPGRGVVIAILLFCQNHYRCHHLYFHSQFIEEEINSVFVAKHRSVPIHEYNCSSWWSRC